MQIDRHHPTILSAASPTPLPVALPMNRLKPGRKAGHVHFPNPLKPSKPDLLEETSLRYFGFTDEIGESWHGVIHHYVPKLQNWIKKSAGNTPAAKQWAHSIASKIPGAETVYNWSYYITGGYAVVDAMHKGYKAYEYHKDSPASDRWKSAVAQTAKTGAFQYLASFLAPLIIVKRARNFIAAALERLPANHALLPKGGLGRLFLPAVICTAMLPVIAHPIDKAVHIGLDWTFKSLGLDKYATFRNDADGSGSPE
jgi:hypothetical protein